MKLRKAIKIRELKGEGFSVPLSECTVPTDRLHDGVTSPLLPKSESFFFSYLIRLSQRGSFFKK